MLLNEMILYHKILIILLLVGLLFGLIVSNGSDIKKIKKNLRVYTFTIHALIATAGFSGLIAFVFAKDGINLNISIMILSYIIITTLETIKYFKILRERELKNIKVINIKFTLLNILIILLNFWEY